jgi:flagellar biosynthesis/type III secretory pathway chaperone
MSSLENEIRTLSQLMDQEVEGYHLIIDALNKEAECLKKGEVDFLLKVVKTIEDDTTILHRLQPPIEASLQRVFDALGKDVEKRSLSRLVNDLPPEHRARMRSYQHTLADLQERVRQMNEKNKTFIREHVTFLSTLTSLMIRPLVENPCYPKTGRGCPAVSLPYTLNREV